MLRSPDIPRALCRTLAPAKFTEGHHRRKMIYALAMMARVGRGPIRRAAIASWQYETARTAIASVARGRKVSEQTRQKMRAAALNRGPEYAATMSRSQRGRTISAATRAKLSVVMKNIAPELRERMDSPRRGRKLPAEVKARMSAAKMGHFVGPDTREKHRLRALGNRWNVGRKRQPLVGEKISKALMGHSVSEDARQKLRVAFSSAERSERAKASWAKRRAEKDT